MLPTSLFYLQKTRFIIEALFVAMMLSVYTMAAHLGHASCQKTKNIYIVFPYILSSQ